MGRSETIHVIGLSEIEPGKDELFCAMSRVDVMQQREKAKRDGKTIRAWYAQTKTGCKIIGAHDVFVCVDDCDVPSARVVKCEVCGGIGKKKRPNGTLAWCVVCNGSGICKNKNWERWQDWQIENMKKEFAEE